MVLLDHGVGFQALRLLASLDELFVRVAFLLTRSLAQLPLVVDLVRQIHAQKLLLLLLGLHIALNLIKRFFWAEMGLVIKFLNGFLSIVSLLLLNDLVPDKGHMVIVLLLLAILLSPVHLVNVVHRRVELILLELALALDPLNLTVESIDGLLVYISNLVKTAGALVS